jgi:hypothetical protein
MPVRQLVLTDLSQKWKILEAPEVELLAEDSQFRDCLPGQYFKLTIAAVCFIPL